MDMMFMNDHFIRSPLRMYSDVDAENNNTSLFSAAMMEKARAHLQMWGRSAAAAAAAGGAGAPGYSSADLHALLMNAAPGSGMQMYVQNRGLPMPLPAHLWIGSGPPPGTASPWTPNSHPGLPPGLLGPPLPPSSSSATSGSSHPAQLTPPPGSSSSSDSPSPSSSSSADLRMSRPIFPGMGSIQHRFSPYHLVPKQLSPTPDLPTNARS
ncbi:hypothetical protein RUM43_009050 [Polyplax serrata]|uniref:Uncharacterized protein n=1 Tax=Polyplax serrata TaxID=468196 RepID=A0AAN8PHK7_POLSC